MKYFLFDHAGFLNRGCEAIVRGTVNVISRSDAKPDFLLSSYSPDTDLMQGVNVEAYKPRGLNSVEKILAKLNLELAHSEYYSLKTAYSPVLKQAENCDICLSIGGDTYCYGDNAPSRAVAIALHKKGKKTVLWGASIGKDDLTAEKIDALKTFDRIFVRESLTYELLEKIIPTDRLFQFSDPAFCSAKIDRAVDNTRVPRQIGFCDNITVVTDVNRLRPARQSVVAAFGIGKEGFRGIINDAVR